MITDGVDEYDMRYDPEDPYLRNAIADSARAGIVVYTIYWHGQGLAGSSSYENDAGQNLLAQLTEATGGFNYWLGYGNPVSFQPYFKDIRVRLRNQYALSFDAPISGKPGVHNLQVKVAAPSVKVDAPQQVYVRRPDQAHG
jgi:hypothetical protein